MKTVGLAVALLLGAGCARHEPPPAKSSDFALLTRGGCVYTTEMRAHFDQALRAAGRPTDYQFIDLDTLPESDVRRGYPTPTLLYKDHDVFGLPVPAPPLPDPT